MSDSPAGLQRCYRIHGVDVEVLATDQPVIDATELRLRDFASNARPDPQVSLEFVAAARNGSVAPAGAGRAVYETPHGSLRYIAEADLLYGELGGVRLRCEATRGVARLDCAAFVGHDLYLATHPLVTISLMELLERRGLFSLHAACLSNDDGHGVLLAGASGAGKSTLALAVVRAGMRFLSDDIVFLHRDRDAEVVRALGFADAVGLSEHAAQRFGELRRLLDRPPVDGFPKRLGRIEDLFGASALRACEPRALVFPEVSRDQPSAIVALDPREALLRLVPDVLLTDAAATQAHLRAIAALLEQVRCYALRSGTDLERAAELMQALV